MKNRIFSGLLCALLLCGCQAPTASETHPPESEKAEDCYADTREQYYQELIEELRREILDIRADFYIKESAYEDRIAELEERLEASTSEGEAETPTERESFLYSVENGYAIITAYQGGERDVKIPERLDGYSVKGIADRAFAEQSQLLSVSVPDGVTSIGWFAFFGCVNLDRVILPESVGTIGYDAFGNCGGSLTVQCASGSYAERYAKSYGIRTDSE